MTWVKKKPYVNDWKLNYMAPAAFLLYYTAANKGQHIYYCFWIRQHILGQWGKRWNRLTELAETWHRNLCALSCLNVSFPPGEACPPATWIINTSQREKWRTLTTVVWRLGLPYGFISTFKSVVCKLTDKRINSSCLWRMKKERTSEMHPRAAAFSIMKLLARRDLSRGYKHRLVSASRAAWGYIAEATYYLKVKLSTEYSWVFSVLHHCLRKVLPHPNKRPELTTQ